MTLFKICSLILFYFLSRVALAAPCEVFTGHLVKEKLCFNQQVKGWMTERGLKDSAEGDVKDFFVEKKKLPEQIGVNWQNPAALYCHQLKLEILILTDAHRNEQSFCVFKDKTMVDANAIERFVQ